MATLPEFLNPESKRYQPWAEKQTGNAAKEKRPLAVFLEELETVLQAVGERPAERWRSWADSRTLARFGPAGPGAAGRATEPGRSRGARRGRRHSARPGGEAGPRDRQPAAGVPQPPGGRRPGAGGGPPHRGQGPGPGAPPDRGTPGPGPSRSGARRRRRRRPGTGPGAGPAGAPASG